jgi:hypothetical protein
MNSRVHPKYKTKYRVSNWAEYDRALVQRGDITLWISADAADAWSPEPSGKRGGRSTMPLQHAARKSSFHPEDLRQDRGDLALGLVIRNHSKAK